MSQLNRKPSPTDQRNQCSYNISGGSKVPSAGLFLDILLGHLPGEPLGNIGRRLVRNGGLPVPEALVLLGRRRRRRSFRREPGTAEVTNDLPRLGLSAAYQALGGIPAAAAPNKGRVSTDQCIAVIFTKGLALGICPVAAGAFLHLGQVPPVERSEAAQEMRRRALGFWIGLAEMIARREFPHLLDHIHRFIDGPTVLYPAVSDFGHDFVAKTLHRGELVPGCRPCTKQDSRDTHLGEFLHPRGSERSTEPRTDRQLERRGSIHRPLMTPQTRNSLASARDALGDSVPSITEASGALERGFGMPAKHDRRIR